MTARRLLRLLTSRRFGCAVLRQRGSPVMVQCGDCRTIVPMHGGDIAPGTWKSIQTALAPCLGEKWWE